MPANVLNQSQYSIVVKLTLFTYFIEFLGYDTAKIVKDVLQSELMITSWTYVTLAYVEKIIRQQQQITQAVCSLSSVLRSEQIHFGGHYIR